MIHDAPLCQFQRLLLKDTAATRPIENLFTWLVDRRNLDAAWERVRSSRGAQTPGADGVTAAEAARRPETWFPRLADDLIQGRWRPTAPRWIEIPKPAGAGTRRLGILTIRDRVVHACLKQILEPLLDAGSSRSTSNCANGAAPSSSPTTRRSSSAPSTRDRPGRGRG